MSDTSVSDSSEKKIHVQRHQGKLPTTRKMIQQILLEHDFKKGITVKGIYNYINTIYVSEITNRRKTLIRAYLTELKEQDILVNVTGKGLTGYLKLTNKSELIERDVEKSKHYTKKTKNSKKINNIKLLQENIKLKNKSELIERDVAKSKHDTKKTKNSKKISNLKSLQENMHEDASNEMRNVQQNSSSFSTKFESGQAKFGAVNESVSRKRARKRKSSSPVYNKVEGMSNSEKRKLKSIEIMNERVYE